MIAAFALMHIEQVVMQRLGYLFEPWGRVFTLHEIFDQLLAYNADVEIFAAK